MRTDAMLASSIFFLMIVNTVMARASPFVDAGFRPEDKPLRASAATKDAAAILNRRLPPRTWNCLHQHDRRMPLRLQFPRGTFLLVERSAAQRRAKRATIATSPAR
jgi:hypothetical protein